MQPSAAVWSDWWHSAIAAWRCSSVTINLPSALKKSRVKPSKKLSRSFSRPLRISSALSWVNGPSGVSSLRSR
ncbi:hypothetical protein G6F64_015502 [Rhizopus arrhizus]|uniref:Uncharacterized protein n=1 Tax=Rhizopus oryzae TaxID=64495 RepID=A0A9P6WR81_RHIOR|nr:hypothetical protein G6F64_015502 [Rhizopus arrhizus]